MNLPVPNICLWLRCCHLKCMVNTFRFLNLLCESIFAYKFPYFLGCHHTCGVIAVPVSLAVEGVKHHLYTAFPGLPCSARALGIWFVLWPWCNCSRRHLTIVMCCPCRHSCLHIVVGHNVISISMRMYNRYRARTAYRVTPHQIATYWSKGGKLLVHIVGAEVCHHSAHGESR